MNNDTEADDQFVLAVIVIVIALLALGANGCGPTRPSPVCVSPCGLELQGPIPTGDWDCQALNDVEAATVVALQTVADSRFADVCAAIRRQHIVIVPELIWQSPNHVSAENPSGLISGLTYCAERWSYVGNASPFESSLPHELVHVVERCNPPNHGDWKALGIYDALDQVRP